MFIKREAIYIILLMLSSVAYGQSDIFLTQQWFSRINMNPAATGNSNHVDVFLLNRLQWLGFENAPRTNLLNAHSYFNTIRSGLGFSLLFDKLGLSHQTVNAKMSYAYHLDLTDELLLSLGLSGGLYNNNWDPKRNTFSQEIDMELLVDKSSRTSADFDTGLEISGYGLIVGMSITHLLNSAPEKSYTGKPGREIYSYVRYRATIDKSFDLVPGIMYRYGNYSNLFDVNVTGYYMKKYWAGISLRPKNSFAMMLGAEYGMFRIGYAYDRSVGAILSLAANTHEFMLAARLHKPQQGRKTTRFLD